jgi:hypothetical protein
MEVSLEVSQVHCPVTQTMSLTCGFVGLQKKRVMGPTCLFVRYLSRSFSKILLDLDVYNTSVKGTI